MNILSISIDDLSAYATMKALYGSIVQTPNIDRLAEQGTVFENAFAQVALCNPSRSSILTGLYPAENGIHGNTMTWQDNIDLSHTLTALMKQAGNEVGVFGKVYHGYNVAREPVLADRVSNDANGFAVNERPTIAASEIDPLLLGDHVNTSAAIDMLNDMGEDEPFAIFHGIFRPHVDWYVPQEYFDLYPIESITRPWGTVVDQSQIPAFMRDLRESQADQLEMDKVYTWQEAIQGYFASITYADAQLGRLLDALEASPHADNTAIVMWSDHGYHLGDHDVWHKFTLWEESARAPLIVSVPGQTPSRVTEPVELIDIFPTVLELAGEQVPEFASGRSLLPFIEDPTYSDGKPAITTMFGSVSMRTDQYRLIRYEDGSTELYDILEDPYQHVNMALNTAFDTLHDALMTEMLTYLDGQGWKFSDLGDSGGAADNYVVGGSAAAVVGGDGDDTYFVDPSVAKIIERADEGFDIAYFSAGGVVPLNVEEVYTYDGDERRYAILGNRQDNVIRGSEDIYGFAGNDTLAGHGLLVGGTGDDTLLAFAFRSVGFEEVMHGGAGNDYLYGDRGDDTLRGGHDDDEIDGGSGNDFITGDGGNDNISGGTGDDRISGGTGDDVIFGVSGDDAVNAGDGNDNVKAGAGNDFVLGAGGDDNLNGGSGNDFLNGGAGVDTINGIDGDDRIFGGEGDDILVGGAGNDRISGGSGADFLLAGEGADTLVYSESDAGVRIDLNVNPATGRQSASGGHAEGDVARQFEHITASAYADHLVGSADNNYIYARGGADIVFGGDGNDLLSGGEGADLFLFAGSDGIDRLTDFQSGVDQIGFLASAEMSYADLTISSGDQTTFVSYDGGVLRLNGVASVDQLDFSFDNVL